MLWKRHRLVGLVVVNRKNKGKMPKNCRVEQRNDIAQQECSSLEGGGGGAQIVSSSVEFTVLGSVYER